MKSKYVTGSLGSGTVWTRCDLCIFYAESRLPPTFVPRSKTSRFNVDSELRPSSRLIYYQAELSADLGPLSLYHHEISTPPPTLFKIGRNSAFNASPPLCNFIWGKYRLYRFAATLIFNGGKYRPYRFATTLIFNGGKHRLYRFATTLIFNGGKYRLYRLATTLIFNRGIIHL